MYHLPNPATLRDRVKVEHFKPNSSSHIRVVASERSQNDSRRLPSIHNLLIDSDERRPSITSESSAGNTGIISSSSSPKITPLSLEDAHVSHTSLQRCRQIEGHLDHYHPYPSPMVSPDQTPLTDPVDKPTRGRDTHRGEYAPRPRQRGPTKRNPKADREADARLELSRCLSNLQGVILAVNPEVPQLAAPIPGRDGGWRELKSNNVNDTVPNPLLYNKTDCLTTGAAVIHQSNAIFDATSDREKTVQSLLSNLITSNPTYDEMLDFLHSLADDEWGSRLAESVSLRGCQGWRMPHSSLDSTRLDGPNTRAKL